MEKIKYGTGVAPAKFDLRDYRAKFKGVATARQFPAVFELPMPDVKSQGQVGSCVAHSLATVIEYFDRTETGNEEPMSTGYIYGNRRNSTWKDSGMRTREALKNATAYGDVLKERFPQNVEVPEAIKLFNEIADEDLIKEGSINRIANFFKLNTVSSIKQCLMTYGPVLVIVKWYDDNYTKDGILYITGNSDKADGQHCMVCYGWDQRGWKIQNSWGTRWGTAGRIILPFNTKFVEVWGIADESNTKETNLKIVHPYSSQFGQKFAKGLNNLINLVLGRKQ